MRTPIKKYANSTIKKFWGSSDFLDEKEHLRRRRRTFLSRLEVTPKFMAQFLKKVMPLTERSFVRLISLKQKIMQDEQKISRLFANHSFVNATRVIL